MAAFYGCNNLTEINVHPLNPSYSSVDGVLFNKSGNTLLEYPMGRSGDYTLPNTVTAIASEAFYSCAKLTTVMIPNGVASIGSYAFQYCSSLANVIMGNSITNIGYGAFSGCTSLTSVTVPNSVTTIGTYAFEDCNDLTAVYFAGNAPYGDPFFYPIPTVYYLPGTSGWGPTFAECPTAPWLLPYPVILGFGPSFGVLTNRFGFIISWATNVPVVVEACTNLVNRTWVPIATNTLANGWSYFSDPQWTSYPTRFYRPRSQ
jgi:hypothetical protein